MREYENTIAYLKNLTKFGVNLGLERIENLLNKIGNPQQKLRVIHIGGTNGKGSTSAFLGSILEQAGYKVGVFISPHLNDYRERISINGELISQADVVKGIGKLRPALEKIVEERSEHPTEFEVSTALALQYFATRQPDFVILEVGLGGTFDSTNVVHPLVSVITSIGLDHMDYLGDTLVDIARAKAGIIKNGVPVVVSVEDPEAFKVIEQQAEMKNASLIKVGRDVRWEKTNKHNFSGELLTGFNPVLMDYHGLNMELSGLEIGLFGEHQFNNASIALAVSEILQNVYMVDISEKALRKGLQEVCWPGRQELLWTNPKILLDGAHNVQGMQSLAKALRDYASDYYKREKLILCLGMLADKEREKALGIIAPLASKIIITKPASPRAGDWQKLSMLAEKYVGKENVLTIENPIIAAQEGLKLINKDDLLLITGSFYMVGPVREYLLNLLQSWSSCC